MIPDTIRSAATKPFANCGLQFLDEAGVSEFIEFHPEEFGPDITYARTSYAAGLQD